ncbi:hypothetical protein OPV22_007283 [Ensete ventricosum]|uniref:Uncharacterized protein n=1 Tax=Ensete ventricosum TaxID=4639 RepID=A0AAV8Q6Q7_ENSVE|nr:hypothetical protein OPV22_007283 [Ensete ventricosum]
MGGNDGSNSVGELDGSLSGWVWLGIHLLSRGVQRGKLYINDPSACRRSLLSLRSLSSHNNLSFLVFRVSFFVADRVWFDLSGTIGSAG